MPAPDLINFMYKYDLAKGIGDYKEQIRLAGECVKYVLTWIAESGAEALKYESDVIKALDHLRVSPEKINQVKRAFDTLRRLGQQVQQVQQVTRTTGPQLWQQIMRITRDIINSLAGGAQNVGRWVMGGCRNMGAGIGAAITAALSAAAYLGDAVLIAIGKAVAAIGGWEVDRKSVV